MEVGFRDQRLARLCASDKALTRRLGAKGARRLKQRLADLEAVYDASELFRLPGRWHPLRAHRTGQISADLDHPRRLIVEPAGLDRLESPGGVDWTQVTGVVIVEIADTHE